MVRNWGQEHIGHPGPLQDVQPLLSPAPNFSRKTNHVCQRSLQTYKETEFILLQILLGQVCSPQFTNYAVKLQPTEYDRQGHFPDSG